MSEIFGSIWWLLVTLGVLITFHEFGHFWVARRLGVGVRRFSIGFGRPLWLRRGKDDVEYVIAAIPLGGFVKMVDEREGEVAAEDMNKAFNRKSVWTRIAVVGAGPLFNLVFAVIAFWIMYMVGIPETRPVVGEVSGIAAQAGIRPGDEIFSLDGDRTATWSHAIIALVTHALDRDRINVTVQDAQGNQSQHELDLTLLADDFTEENTLEAIGLRPWRLEVPPVIGEVSSDSAADSAGMRSGDRIIRIAGEEVGTWSRIGQLVQTHGRENEPLAISVERDGRLVDLQVSPHKQSSGLFSSRLILGITNAEISEQQRETLERTAIMMQYGPVEGFAAAIKETWRLTGSTFGLLARMVSGSASVKNLSGPISIAQFANNSASRGLSNFLFFLGAISLSLGILNLLPIPVLDGGHLLYFLIELVKGSPLSDRVQLAGQYFGLMALAGLMGLAFFNDILRLVG